MTDEMMSLRTLVEKTPDADILREMIGFAAECLMEMEVGGLTGAGYGQKNPTATWQRCRVHFMRNALAHAGRLHHSVGHDHPA